MHVPTLIEKKRDGLELTSSEIQDFIARYTAGELPDYQASAWAMAVYFQGMTAAETGALTRAMMHSGSVFRYPKGTPQKVDKHSTGGVGDKVSLILAPLLACDGLWVPMISGRGLGITGGTLDKLQSIPGFRVELSELEALKQLERIGVVMIGQTPDLCPADRKLYALRDVTGTVPSRPLIVASIMSKKLAESLDRLVLDVKWGAGAFMKTQSEATLLATDLAAVGQEMGVDVTYQLTPMNEPLGRTVGNALEVAEAVEVLTGAGPPDVVELTLDLASRVSRSTRSTLTTWLEDGTAWNRFVALVESQGGDASRLSQISAEHPAPFRHEVRSPAAGMVVQMDAGSFGRASVLLGGGRRVASDQVDVAVGFSEIRKVGDVVMEGETLAVVHARSVPTLHAALAAIQGGIAVE